MKSNITELVFILDRSGSMAGLEADTIGGFNAMLEKQKKQEGKAYVSTILFDNTSEVLHDRISLEKVKPITDNDYYVRGCTALLDAIGNAINHISNIHKREEYRKNSFIAPVAIGQIMGFGIAGYVMALDYILGIENGK